MSALSFTENRPPRASGTVDREEVNIGAATVLAGAAAPVGFSKCFGLALRKAGCLTAALPEQPSDRPPVHPWERERPELRWPASTQRIRQRTARRWRRCRSWRSFRG